MNNNISILETLLALHPLFPSTLFFFELTSFMHTPSFIQKITRFFLVLYQVFPMILKVYAIIYHGLPPCLSVFVEHDG